MKEPNLQPLKPKPEPKRKRKNDPFWPIVIILSILAFTGSFWFFYMLTSKINTKEFETTETPKLMVTPIPSDDLLSSPAIMLGDGNLPSPTPTPEASLVPSQAPAVVSATPEATPIPEETPAAVSTPATIPTPLPTLTPRPAVSAVLPPTTRPAQTKPSFRVQVGSFATRENAQKTASELTDLGYSATVTEDAGRFQIQLGTYQDQEGALALAEEVTQRGYAVVVRKVEL
jgi:cell division protein FtsN